MVIWPGQTSERPTGEEESCAQIKVITVLSSARTVIARKAYRQLANSPPECSTRASAPPINGDMKPPAVSAAAQIEIPCARSWIVWVPAAIIAIEVGKIAAAP